MKPRVAFLLAILLASPLVAAAPTPALAVTLAGGDLIVTDAAGAAVYRLNPMTAAATVISSGGALVSPAGVALGADGQVLVADPGAGAVVQIDPASGAQTVVSSGGLLQAPVTVVVEPDGHILVGDTGVSAVFRIDPSTGAQAVLSSGGSLGDLTDIDLENDGHILVASPGVFGGGGIIRVDPVTGAQGVALGSPPLTDPTGVAVANPFENFIVDPAVDTLWRWAGSALTPIASGAGMNNPVDLAVEAGGTIAVIDSDFSTGSGRLLRFSASGGGGGPVGALAFAPSGVAVVGGGSTPIRADLAVTMTGPSTASTRSLITYGIQVSNLGPGSAGNVVLSDETPVGTAFESVGGSGWSCTTPKKGKTGTVRCLLTSLSPGAVSTSNITLKVTAKPDRGVINNVARVTSDSVDPDVRNNDVDDSNDGTEVARVRSKLAGSTFRSLWRVIHARDPPPRAPRKDDLHDDAAR